jgi:hypothetical protein
VLAEPAGWQRVRLLAELKPTWRRINPTLPSRINDGSITPVLNCWGDDERNKR